MKYRSILLIVCLFSTLSPGQTTRPFGGRAVKFGERIQELMGQLDLTDDQKQKINDIVQQAKQQFQQELPELRDKTPQERQAKIKDIVEGVRQEIGDLLTPEQREKLQLLIQQQRQRDGANGNGDNATGAATRRLARANNSEGVTPTTRPAPMITHEAVAPVENKFTGTTAQIGQPAPEVPLHLLNGEALKLSKFKKAVVVLVFGSYSTPAFRDKATALPGLAERYSGRVKFLIVYTKEAHPSDGWTVKRNEDDNVQVAQPTNIAGRRDAAMAAVTALHLSNIPVLLDTMDDTAAQTYDAYPDGVIVIGKDGKLVARQHWLDPSGLPELIDKELNH